VLSQILQSSPEFDPQSFLTVLKIQFHPFAGSWQLHLMLWHCSDCLRAAAWQAVHPDAHLGLDPAFVY